VGSVRDGAIAMTPTAVIGLRSRFRSPGTRTRPYLLATHDLRRLRHCRVCAPRVKGEPRTDVILLSHYDALELFPFADDSIHSMSEYCCSRHSRYGLGLITVP